MKSKILAKNSEILSFLRRLEQNNNKPWMDANREEYYFVRDSFRQWVTERLKEIAEFDPSIEGLALKDIIYRINRNIRFNKEAPPYKNYLGVSFSKGGKKSDYAEYYFQIRPDGNTCIGGGVWGAKGAEIAKIRQEIDYNPEPLLDFLNNREVKKYYGPLYAHYKLKTAPRGYSQDHQLIDLLRLKHYFVFHHFGDEELDKANFNKQVIKGCKIVQPLVQYINQALE